MPETRKSTFFERCFELLHVFLCFMIDAENDENLWFRAFWSLKTGSSRNFEQDTLNESSGGRILVHFMTKIDPVPKKGYRNCVII